MSPAVAVQQAAANPKVNLRATPLVRANGARLGLCLVLAACGVAFAPTSAPVAILVPEPLFLVGLDARIFPSFVRSCIELAVRLPVPGWAAHESMSAAALQALVSANVDHRL